MNVYELFAKIGLDTSEYDAGLQASEMKAKSFGGTMSSALSGVGSVAGTALKGVGSVAGTALKVVDKIGGMAFDSAKGTAELADQIDKASQKLGISSTAYQEWDAVLQHSGTSMASMATSFRTLANAAQDASKDQVSAFKRIGLSMEDVAGMSTEKLWASVISGLQGMDEGTERTAIATDLLGRGATELGALLNTSAEDTQKMIDTVHELGGVMSDDAVKSGASFEDNVQDVRTVVQGLKRDIGEELIPVFDSLMKLFLDNQEPIQNFAHGAVELLSGAIGGISSAIDAVKAAWEAGKAAWAEIKAFFVSGEGSSSYNLGAAIIAGQEMLAGTYIPPEATGNSKSRVGRFKTGLGFVPYDYFPAYLDHGEMVLTEQEANKVRSLDFLDNMQDSHVFLRRNEEQTELKSLVDSLKALAAKGISVTVNSVLDGRVIGETAYNYIDEMEMAVS